jgi:hypothetical protein
MRQLKGIGFRTIQAGKRGKRRLNAYRRKRQEFLLQLPPQELWDVLRAAFIVLQATCKDLEVATWHWHDWVSDKTWLLIKRCTSLHWAGRLRWCIRQRMQRTIYTLLKVDRTARMAQVSKSIVANLAKGNMHEAFRHLNRVLGGYGDPGPTMFPDHGKADDGSH